MVNPGPFGLSPARAGAELLWTWAPTINTPSVDWVSPGPGIYTRYIIEWEGQVTGAAYAWLGLRFDGRSGAADYFFTDHYWGNVLGHNGGSGNTSALLLGAVGAAGTASAMHGVGSAVVAGHNRSDVATGAAGWSSQGSGATLIRVTEGHDNTLSTPSVFTFVEGNGGSSFVGGKFVLSIYGVDVGVVGI